MVVWTPCLPGLASYPSLICSLLSSHGTSSLPGLSSCCPLPRRQSRVCPSPPSSAPNKWTPMGSINALDHQLSSVNGRHQEEVRGWKKEKFRAGIMGLPPRSRGWNTSHLCSAKGSCLPGSGNTSLSLPSQGCTGMMPPTPLSAAPSSNPPQLSHWDRDLPNHLVTDLGVSSALCLPSSPSCFPSSSAFMSPTGPLSRLYLSTGTNNSLTYSNSFPSRSELHAERELCLAGS